MAGSKRPGPRRPAAGDTIAAAFVATAGACPDLVALRWRRGDSWDQLTYGQYAERVARAVTGLRALGVRAGDRVMLMMRNIPEFHIVDTACMFCGATPISIYNSSSAEQVAYLVSHSRATMAIVEDESFLARFRTVRHQIPTVRALGAVTTDAADFHFDDLLAHEQADLAALNRTVQAGDLATIIYTSGTTGPPKGVMLSHHQVVATTTSLVRALGVPLEEHAGMRVVSYLPMAHIAERMTSHYNAIVAGYEITTCPDVALLGGYLRDVRPHIFFGVPRVWEKLHAGVVAALAADPEQLAQFEDGVAAAGPIVEARTWDRSTAEQDATWQFLDDVAFAPVRHTLGLDQLVAGISSAAPIAPELLAWFRAIGVPLSELYGMSESCGPITWSALRVKAGTVGQAIPGCQVRLAPDGEVLCRGDNVFAGYLDDPERTAEALDAGGWLHTGDLGELDADGYLRIIDRKKELIITAGGKNISPANLEAKLKLVPLVGQAVVIGDNRPFVSALLVLDPDRSRVFAATAGIAYDSLADLARAPQVLAAIDAGVREVMAGFNHAEQVKKYIVLGHEWLPDSDELTPTSKLKRRAISAKYAAEIASLYQ